MQWSASCLRNVPWCAVLAPSTNSMIAWFLESCAFTILIATSFLYAVGPCGVWHCPAGCFPYIVVGGGWLPGPMGGGALAGLPR